MNDPSKEKCLEVIRRFHQPSKAPPVDVIGIANAMGIAVFRANWNNRNISGQISFEADEKRYEIVTNAREAWTRRRFTIAHEIAHFVYHRHLIDPAGLQHDRLFRSNLSGPIEWEANGAAADILMPRYLVNRAIVGGCNSVTELAGLFNVSVSAMSIRLGVPAYEEVSTPSPEER